MNLNQPLYAEEPRFVLLDRRDEQEESPDGSPNEDDPFWVTRGRRQYDLPFASEYGQSLWASTRRIHDLIQDEKLSRVLRSRLTENGFLESTEEPFWAPRGKRSSFKFAEGLRHRYVVPKSLSGNRLCWSSRGRRSAIDDSRNVRGFLQSLSVEEPFWAARGKKSDLHNNDEPRDTCRLLKSTLAEEPLWAERGERSAGDGREESRQRRRPLELTSLNEPAWINCGEYPALHCAQNSETKRGLLESLSADDPFWVARGRRKDGELGDRPQRRGGLVDSLSVDEPFWAARGRRGFLDALSTEEPFWAARGKKESLAMTSPSAEELLSQVSILNDTH